MNIHLGKELERNREYQQLMAELRQSIDAGWQQAEHGELVDFEPDKILNRVNADRVNNRLH